MNRGAPPKIKRRLRQDRYRQNHPEQGTPRRYYLRRRTPLLLAGQLDRCRRDPFSDHRIAAYRAALA
jgi:hypothetical protein